MQQAFLDLVGRPYSHGTQMSLYQAGPVPQAHRQDSPDRINLSNGHVEDIGDVLG